MKRQTPLWILLLIIFATQIEISRGQDTVRPEMSIEAILAKAGENASKLERAYQSLEEPQKTGLKFLLENMPEADLRSLTDEFLTENVRLAYQAREESRWGSAIPDDIFFNDVLPYACINEHRDNWRKEFHQRFSPVVAGIETPSKAAAKLNQTIYKELNVKYSTKRRRADQGPRESINSGLASCTGLSILLIDACRSVGIPARFVGTPLWTDGSGNHSWVEVWDNGWHFTGAAEPNGDELDKAWFVERAKQATANDLKHAIFATSFRRTPLNFPMVWSPQNRDVFAVNVTERYTQIAQPDIPVGFVRTRFKTLGAVTLDRCQANLVVRNAAGEVLFRGQSKDERFDANDHLTAALPSGEELEVEVESNGQISRQRFATSQDGQLVTLRLNKDDKASNTLKSASSTEKNSEGEALVALSKYLTEAREQRPSLIDMEFAKSALTKAQAEKVLEMLAHDHQSWIANSRKQEIESKSITIGDAVMPFELKLFGDKPEEGHSLVISMHGGGGAPAQVNDQQWKNQQRLYELEEGVYVAPRAPTNTWNLWHLAHIDQLFSRLIEDMIVFHEVNPNRVYITGYSAGGDGVFQLAPRMADQLAAAAMMAGHPNETKPLGLRNLPFTLHVGGKDAAYDRNKKAEVWAKELAELREADPKGYEHWAKIYPEKGHWMDREDREGVAWMLKFTRNLIPEKIIWLQDDVTHSRFYWLQVNAETAKAGDKIVARRDGQKFFIDEAPVGELTLLLRDDMVNLDQEIEVSYRDKSLFKGKVERTTVAIYKTLIDRGDRTATFSARATVQISD